MIEHFGDMEIHTGHTHNFLGMLITITKDKKVKLDMTVQVKTLIKEFEEEHDIVLQKVTSPATEGLFDPHEELEQLDQHKTAEFHSNTAKLLYLMKRARPDIETTVSYLMRRVSKSNTGDWDKLLRVLGWLKSTKDDV